MSDTQVLVVDEDVVTRELVRGVLELAGHEVPAVRACASCTRIRPTS